MLPEQREALIRHLMLSELAAGKGDERQRAAWQEIEWRRCKASCEYWLDRYGYIIDAGEVRKWHLWPVQRMLVADLQVKLEHARATHEAGGVAAVKARQLGITTITAHFDFWDILFHDASRWDMFAHSEEKGKEIVERVQATKDRLPRWMVARAEDRARIEDEEFTRRGKKADSVKKIQYGFSQMKIASSTPKNIQGATANIVLDEFTQHEDKTRKLRQMHATIDGASGIAVVIANGEGEDTFFHLCRKVCPKAFNAKGKGLHNWDFHFFWWGDAPYRLKDAFVTVDGEDIPAIRFSRDELMDHAAAGRLTSPWYQRELDKYLLENPEADEYAFKAIYPTTLQEAFYISGNSRFKLSVINDYAQDIRERRVECLRGILEHDGTNYTLLPSGKGPWRVFAKPVPEGRYVIGLDSSGGSQSGDYAVAQVFRQLGDMRAEQVAVLQSKMEPTELAYEALKAARWYNEAYLVPEANNTGQLLIDRLKVDYYNLYMRKARVERFSNADSDNIGFWTDSGSKPRLVGNLAEFLYKGYLVLNDSITVQELVHYEIHEDGIKTGAPKGMNDDCVMALALAVEGVIDSETFHMNSQPRVLLPWE